MAFGAVQDSSSGRDTKLSSQAMSAAQPCALGILLKLSGFLGLPSRGSFSQGLGCPSGKGAGVSTSDNHLELAV